jgi:hypothetical protein
VKLVLHLRLVVSVILDLRLFVKLTPVALFTKLITMKNCGKCITKIKKSFTKILTIILSVNIVLTLRVKLPCRKCKRNICLIFYRKWKYRKKRWTMHWRFCLKIREQFTVSAFSLTVWQTSLHILINFYWNKYGLIQTDATNEIVVYSLLAWLITESITMHSVHLPFQLHINYHMTQTKIRINLEFFYKNRNTGFSSRHLLRLLKFCMNRRYRTGSFASNNIVSILPLY